MLFILEYIIYNRLYTSSTEMTVKKVSDTTFVFALWGYACTYIIVFILV